MLTEWAVRVCSDAVLLDFWCSFAEIFILSCGIAVYKTKRFAVFRNFRVISMRFAVFLLFCAVFSLASNADVLRDWSRVPAPLSRLICERKQNVDQSQQTSRSGKCTLDVEKFRA